MRPRPPQSHRACWYCTGSLSAEATAAVFNFRPDYRGSFCRETPLFSSAEMAEMLECVDFRVAKLPKQPKHDAIIQQVVVVQPFL